jgi:hypothetical protein
VLTPFSSTRQLLFLAGVVTTIGPRAAARFFTKKRNARGTAAFATGLLLVVCRYPLLGVAAQAYGSLRLFADFLPSALPFLRRVPVLGSLLSLRPGRDALGRLGKSKRDSLPV